MPYKRKRRNWRVGEYSSSIDNDTTKVQVSIDLDFALPSRTLLEFSSAIAIEFLAVLDFE